MLCSAQGCDGRTCPCCARVQTIGSLLGLMPDLVSSNTLGNHFAEGHDVAQEGILLVTFPSPSTQRWRCHGHSYRGQGPPVERLMKWPISSQGWCYLARGPIRPMKSRGLGLVHDEAGTCACYQLSAFVVWLTNDVSNISRALGRTKNPRPFKRWPE